MGPKDGLDGCGKSRPQSVLDPRTVHPVANCYTNELAWATLVSRGLDKTGFSNFGSEIILRLVFGLTTCITVKINVI